MIENENPDVICIVECIPKNLGNDINSVELEIPGYNCFSNLGQEQCHRGVAIWTRLSLGAQPYKLESKHSNIKESVWCEVPLRQGDRLLVGAVYRSPSSGPENDCKVNEMLVDLTVGRTHVLICGDFNRPEIDWVEVSTSKTCEHPAYKFLEAVRDSFLTQHVVKPTHFRGDQTPNVLDLIFTSEEAMAGDIRHEAPLGKSHHHSLCFQFQCYTKSADKGVDRYIYSKGDFVNLKKLVDEQNLVSQMVDLGVSEAWDTLRNVVHNAMEECIPKVRVGVAKKARKPLWLNDSAMAKVKKKRQAYERYLQTRDGQDYLQYARARNQARKACRTAVRELEKSVAKKAKQNPKAFFAYARSKTKTRDGISDLSDSCGEKVTTDHGKANLLNSYFSSVFTEEDLTQIPNCGVSVLESVLEDIEFNSEQVKEKLEGLNPNKSAGPDKFHPRVLKELAHELAEPLCLIFRKSFAEGKLPADWKCAQVTPLFKKGDKSTPGNYRPVSLTSVVSKVLESLIRDKVMGHLVANNLVSDCQHGFVPGRACTTNLLACIDDWTAALDEGRDVDAIYLDLAKAFDTVPHIRLLKKLEALGVRGNVLAWIKDFLSDRKQSVCVNGVLSDWSAVKSGVPQGSVLGPTLFVAFINDLPEVVSDSSGCKMYADDTKVYSCVDDSEKASVLQEDLDKLVDWADRWQLRFNSDKCTVLHLGNGNDRHMYQMRNHGRVDKVDLQASECERDLGIQVDSDLKFSKHIETQVNKANRLLGLVRRSYEYLDCETMKLLFTAIVRPHLEFGNVVWAPHLEKDKKLIEGVLRRATRVVSGVKDLEYEERLEKIKLPSMTYRRVRGDLIETYKYTHGFYRNQDSMFTLDTDRSTRGHSFKLKKFRCKTTLRQHFFNQRVVERWNNLPASVVEAPSINAFKNRVDAFYKEYIYSLVEPPSKIKR